MLWRCAPWIACSPLPLSAMAACCRRSNCPRPGLFAANVRRAVHASSRAKGDSQPKAARRVAKPATWLPTAAASIRIASLHSPFGQPSAGYLRSASVPRCFALQASAPPPQSPPPTLRSMRSLRLTFPSIRCGQHHNRSKCLQLHGSREHRCVSHGVPGRGGQLVQQKVTQSHVQAG